MKEIKIRIGKGGKANIKVGKMMSGELSQFTEKLAKDLGDIEERHKPGQHEAQGHGQNTEEQATVGQ